MPYLPADQVRRHEQRERWFRLHRYSEWARIVGDRCRRLRNARDLALHQIAEMIETPGGRSYTPGYLSRLERGWSKAPLHVYVGFAEAVGVAPGILLGPDEAQRIVTAPEMTLVLALREMGLEPHVALARLATTHAPGGIRTPDLTG